MKEILIIIFLGALAAWAEIEIILLFYKAGIILGGQ